MLGDQKVCNIMVSGVNDGTQFAVQIGEARPLGRPTIVLGHSR